MQQRSSFPLNREFDVSLNLNLTRLNRVKPGLGESCESDRETKRTRGSVKRERKKKRDSLGKKEKGSRRVLTFRNTMVHTNLPTTKHAHIHIEFLVESGSIRKLFDLHSI